MANGQRINTALMYRARMRKGWTLRQVSERCEELGTPVDHGNLARYEHGQIRPVPRTLLVIARALDLTVDELLAEDDANGSAA